MYLLIMKTKGHFEKNANIYISLLSKNSIAEMLNLSWLGNKSLDVFFGFFFFVKSIFVITFCGSLFPYFARMTGIRFRFRSQVKWRNAIFFLRRTIMFSILSTHHWNKNKTEKWEEKKQKSKKNPNVKNTTKVFHNKDVNCWGKLSLYSVWDVIFSHCRFEQHYQYSRTYT